MSANKVFAPPNSPFAPPDVSGEKPESFAEYVAFVGAHVRAMREAAGLSQRAVAELADISNATLSELESGIAPNLDHAPKVRQVLKTYMWDRVEEMQKHLRESA